MWIGISARFLVLVMVHILLISDHIVNWADLANPFNKWPMLQINLFESFIGLSPGIKIVHILLMKSVANVPLMLLLRAATGPLLAGAAVAMVLRAAAALTGLLVPPPLSSSTSSRSSTSLLPAC